MTKSELTKHIEKTTGKMFLSAGEIVKVTGFGKDTVKEIVRNLDYVTIGTEKRYRKYYIEDISQAIMERRILA